MDVYGVRRPRNGVSKRQQLTMRNNVLFALRCGLRRRQAIKLALQLDLAANETDAHLVWLDGLVSVASRLGIEWPKRRRQLIEQYEKFILPKQIDETQWLIRKNPGGTPCVNPLHVPDILNGNNFDVVQMPSRNAQERWIDSFRLEMLGIDHLRPLVFEPPNLLYFERLPDGSRPAPDDLASEFVEDAAMLGFAIFPETLLMLPNGRIIVSDYDGRALEP